MNLLTIEALNNITTNTSSCKNHVFIKHSKSNISFLKGLLKQGLIQNFTVKSKTKVILIYLKFDQNSNSAINSIARIAKIGQNLKLTKGNHFISKANFNILFASSKKTRNTERLVNCFCFIK